MAARILIVIISFFLTTHFYAQSNNTLLWRIDHPITKKSSYLFGTIQVAQLKFNKIDDSVYVAIKKCQKFYTEINLKNGFDDEVLKELETVGEYVDSLMQTPRWNMLVENTSKKYNIVTKQKNGEDIIDSIRARLYPEIWEKDKGALIVDLLLQSFAEKNGLDIDQLETVGSQMTMLFELVKEQLNNPKMTEFTADDAALTHALYTHYENQNLDSIAYLITTIKSKFVLNKMLFDRNITMANAMEYGLQTKNCFFAVGAAHLPGPKGLIALMKKRGYTVTPVFGSIKIPYQLVLDNNNIIKKALKQLSKTVE